MTNRQFRIGIVAGEPSGDSLGAGLIRALQCNGGHFEFFGIGGPKMRSAGCDTLYDMDRIEVMGLDGLFDKAIDILKIRSHLYKMMLSNPPDLFIGIDVPDFNLSLEARLKKRKIATIHYVSPTLWAWRGYRIHKVRRATDHMLTLFPFEADYYKKNKIPVTCVGHPIADEIEAPDKYAAREKLGLKISKKGGLVALLPGSRRSEVSRLAPIFIQAAQIILKNHSSVQFILPFANKKAAAVFGQVTRVGSDFPITFIHGQSRLAMEAADVVVLASGTAALEAALLRRPHIVSYKVNLLTYWLVQRLKHVSHFSMPNNLLGEPVVPEFIQDQATPENISAQVMHYISHPQAVDDLEAEFTAIREQLRLDANQQAGKIVKAMLRSE